MEQEWIHSVLAILDAKGKPIGTGFLVANKKIVTCAHVVKACGSGPGQNISVRFQGRKEKRLAAVLQEYWSELDDVAILNIKDSKWVSPPPLVLCRCEHNVETQIQTFGYPNLTTDGLWGNASAIGLLTDENERKLIQLSSGEITAGFSGAPLWDVENDCVIGMVTEIVLPDRYDRLGEVAFGTPVETIGRVCPMLNELIQNTQQKRRKKRSKAKKVQPQTKVDQQIGTIQTGGIAVGSIVTGSNSTVIIGQPAEAKPSQPAEAKQEIRPYKVFLASPTDVLDERKVALTVIDQLNGEFSRNQMACRLEVRLWDRHAYPDAGLPMDVIRKQIPIEECDIFVCAFWRRMGTAPNTQRPGDEKPYMSGTEQELEEALEARRKNKHRPVIMIYRKMDPPSSEMSDDDHIQYGDLLRYLKKFEPVGEHPATIMKFEKNDFRELLTEHLRLAVLQFEIASERAQPRETPATTRTVLPSTAMTGTMSQWLESLDLRGNPFQHNIAEYEQSLPQIFVEPSRFPVSELWDFDGTILTFAKPGMGKTALKRFLAAQCYPRLATSDLLGIEVGRAELEEMLDRADGYASRLMPAHFAQKVIRQALNTVEARIPVLDEQRAPPSDPLSMKQFTLEQIDDLVHFASLPAEMIATSVAYAFLTRLVSVASSLGFRRVVAMVDQVDEPAHVEGDPEQIAMLLPALLSRSLREAPGVMSRYFLPDYLAPWVNDRRDLYRPDRCHIYHLAWSEQDLKKLIRERLVQYSTGPTVYESLRQLCDQEDKLAQDIEIELIRMARGHPRVTIWLVNKLFQVHCEPLEPFLHIQARDWQQVKLEWDTRDQEQFFPQMGSYDVARPSRDSVKKQTLRLLDERIFVNEREIVLQQRYHAMLLSLLQAAGEVRSRGELARSASPGETPVQSDRGVSDAIRRIKKILQDNGVDPECIETVRGRGFRIDPSWVEPDELGEDGYDDDYMIAPTEAE